MINNNYYKLYNTGMRAAALKGAAGNNSNSSTTNIATTVKDPAGHDVSHAIYGLVDNLSHSIPSLITSKPSSSIPTSKTPATGSSFGGFVIALGSGTTVATPDDYNIENIITTLSYISATFVSDTTGDVYNLKRSLLFQNTGSQSISVSEICLFGRMDALSMSNGVLLYREVLTEPITIEPNDYFTITLSTDGQVIV